MRVTDRDHALLRSIEDDLLDQAVTTTSILQKVIILGGRAGSVALRDWARKELHGYGGEDDVPSYRTVNAVIQMDYVNGSMHATGQTIGCEDLPDAVTEKGYDNTITFVQGIAELEAMAASNGPSKFSRSGNSMIIKMMESKLRGNNPFLQITGLYWVVSSASITGVGQPRPYIACRACR